MALYEHVFIARQDVSQQQVEALTEQYSNILKEQGGSVSKTEYWGLRNLAFKVKKNRKGHYTLMNIDVAVSPRLQCAQQILRFVRSGSVSSIAVIADGRAEVLELEVHFAGGRKGRRVQNLGLPDGAKIGAVVRSEEVFIPNGDSIIEDGDQVILFTLPDEIRTVENIFREQDHHVSE